MRYRLLADLVVAVHVTFIIFVVVGGLLVWRWPRLLWLHVPAALWGVLIVGIGFPCPLTWLEKYLRRMGAEQVYAGGFIDHYIKGELYPRGLNPLMQALAVVVTVVGYTGLLMGRRHAHARLTARPPTA
ncbi:MULTISPECIES: DUF2784 domain-containing protein [unclassified Frankia]|uniref:DUF2784 domain-containing protein n=1 Tax=unclassified Frankia TaxID=2632575 RepID=UPI002AD3416B|nr:MULTISPECIES: DUF2784 domain-containing protein [unclassified Frankia]